VATAANLVIESSATNGNNFDCFNYLWESI